MTIQRMSFHARWLRAAARSGKSVDRSLFAPRLAALVVMSFVLSSVSTLDGETPVPGPLSPRESMRKTLVRQGYSLELMAAEPLVADPVAIDWGMDGKLWVAEMADYPYGMDGQGEPGGRVRYLEDTNDDGIYDRSTVFLDQLSFPTAVMPWRNGVFVTAAPELIFAQDTDGDGKADRREVIYRGFMQGNQQLRVNGLRFGLDNWIYCAAGGHHAGFGAKNSIVNMMLGESIPLGSRDFRFDPETWELVPLSGPSQFGRVRDDWNHWFGVQNSFPLWHYVLEDDDLQQNPRARYPDARQQLRLPPNPAVFPAKAAQKRFHSFEHANHYTSACGPSIYRDRSLFAGPLSEEAQVFLSPNLDDQLTHAFTCEPFHNVVQHHWLTPHGPSFRAERAPTKDDYDFFASADRWSRPVMTRTGPDGCLWIVDMYRYMIEHPDWLPEEGREELKPYYRAGEGMGRIYRVFPTGQRPQSVPTLQEPSAEKLLEALESSNGVLRDWAQRLLVRRRMVHLAPQLRTLAREHSEARTRLQSLYTLAGLDRARQHSTREAASRSDRDSLLDEDTYLAALQDAEPEVRRHAIQLGETILSPSDAVLERLESLASDASPHVQLQFALSAGRFTDPRIGRALGRLAAMPDLDPFMIAAISASTPRHVATLAKQVAELSMDPEVLATVIDSIGQDAESQSVLAEQIIPAKWSTATKPMFERASAWLAALEQRGTPLEKMSLDEREQWSPASERLALLFEQAWTLALDPDAPREHRSAALQLAWYDLAGRARHAGRLHELLEPQVPHEVQRAAVELFRRSLDDEAIDQLIDAWTHSLPSIRAAIAETLLSQPHSAEALALAISDDGIAARDLDALTRDRLLKYPVAEVKNAAQIAMASLTNDDDRAEVIRAHRRAVDLPGSLARGQSLFQKHCATCHAPSEGVALGPRLNALSNPSATSLLTAILAPSQAVEPQYLAYHVELTNGQTYFGLVAGESGATIRLRLADGREVRLPRNTVESVTASRRSFMPDGFEQQVDAQGFADLIAYIRSLE